MSATPLLSAFRASLPESVRVTDADDEVEQRLAQIVARARAAWPTVALDETIFVAHVAARVESDAEVPRALATMHTDDLYLACACAIGNASAVAAFQNTIVRDLDRAIVPAAGDRIDEVRQIALDRLLVAADGSPRIVLYRGRGALHAWVRVVAARIALDLASEHPREVTLADAAIDTASAAADPELAHFKATYRDELKRSIELAAASLSPRERNLLRYTLLDGLTIDDVGALYSVHRATAARWLSQARDELSARTKQDLRDRLGLARTELDSLFRLVDSQFEVNWSVIIPRAE